MSIKPADTKIRLRSLCPIIPLGSSTGALRVHKKTIRTAMSDNAIKVASMALYLTFITDALGVNT